MEGVCIVLGEKADWDTAKRVLGDSSFIKRLVEYDKDNMSDRVTRLLKRIIEDPQFTHDQVRAHALLCVCVCVCVWVWMWVRV